MRHHCLGVFAPVHRLISVVCRAGVLFHKKLCHKIILFSIRFAAFSAELLQTSSSLFGVLFLYSDIVLTGMLLPRRCGRYIELQ